MHDPERRTWAALALGLAILLGLGWATAQKEHVLQHGETLLL